MKQWKVQKKGRKEHLLIVSSSVTKSAGQIKPSHFFAFDVLGQMIIRSFGLVAC